MGQKDKMPDKFLVHHEAELKQRIGPEHYSRTREEAQRNYSELAPQAPVYREKINRKLFEYAVPCLAIYKALCLYMQEHEAYEVMEYLVKETARDEVESSVFRRFLLRHLSRFRLIGRYYEKSLTSLKEPHGWLARPVPDEERSSDTVIAFNMTRCGICEYYEVKGVPELSRVMCHADAVAASYMRGIRFQRLETIAEGCEVCDFQYFRV
jgi:hypothetical protein